MAEPWSSNDIIRTFAAFLCIGLILKASYPYKVAKMAISSSRLTSYQFSKPSGKTISYPYIQFSKKDVGSVNESSLNKVIGTEGLRIKSDK